MTRALWLSLVLFPLPLVVYYLKGLWTIDEYQYFPVLIACLGTLVYGRWDRVPRSPDRGSWALVAVGVAVTLAAVVIASPWLAMVALVTNFGAWLWSHERRIKSSVFAPHLLELWPLSWLLIRLPLSLDQKLTVWLQHVSAAFSSVVLDILGIVHRIQGVTIELASGTLFIEEACSGVQSLFTLLFCAFLMVAWFQRSVILLPLYAVAAAASAGIMNVVRISTVAWAQEVKGIDVAHGVPHAILGYVCLAGAILLLLSFDRLMRILFYPVPGERTDTDQSNPLRQIWNSWFSRQALTSEMLQEAAAQSPPIASAPSLRPGPKTLAIASALGLVFWIPQITYISRDFFRDRTPGAIVPVGGEGLIWEPAELSLAGATGVTLSGYQKVREGDDIQLGRNADIWNVKVEGIPAVSRVALSQPYDGFHDLCICYAGSGWTESEKGELEFRDQQGSEGVLVKTLFKQKDGQVGYLSFSGIKDDGTTAAVPKEPTLGDILANRFSWSSVEPPTSDHEVAMLQIWTVCETPLKADDVKKLYGAHEAIHRVIQTSMRTPSK